MAPIVNKRRAHSPVLTSAGGVRAIRNRLVLAAVAATAILWLYGALPVAEQVNKVNPTEALTIREITAVPLGDGSERNGGVLLRRHADKERWGPEDSQFREEFHRASVAKEAPVFVLGAMKAGSSALCEFLARHPQIAGGRHYGEEPKHYQKEIHYFDSDERWGKGISFYWDHWGADAAEEKLLLDGTPTYLPNPMAPERIRRTFPSQKMKFIVVVRDPVDRILSHWRHILWHSAKYRAQNVGHWTVRLAKRSFSEHVTRTISEFDQCAQMHKKAPRSPLLWEDCHMVKTDNTLLTISLYDLQLELWHKKFSPASFCIISSDALRRNTGVVLSRISEFLGLDKTLLEDWVSTSLSNAKRHSTQVGRSAVTWQPDPGLLEAVNEFIRMYGNRTMQRLETKGGFIGC